MTPTPPPPIVPIPPATTLTYEQSNALMADYTFKGRVKVACLKYADSIIGEPTATDAHNTRLRWAQSCLQNPENTATQTQPGTVMDAAVQSQGSAIDDQALQGSVEATVNKSM